MTRATPAPRLVGSLLLGTLVGAMVAGRFETAIGCTALGLLGCALARAPWPERRHVAGLLIAVATTIALNVLLVRGAALLPFRAPFGGSREGLVNGLLLALRLVGAWVALHGLRAAWPGETAADELAGRARGLERFGVPVRAGRAVIGLALRFAPLVAAEAARIVSLQDHRAGGPPRSRALWVARRRALAVPLLVCTLERAERVALGMEARHYRVRPVPPVVRSWAGEVGGMGVAAVALLWRG